jgi:hypothetical protein
MQIDEWFKQIAGALREATRAVKLGAEELLDGVEARFESLTREIVDCVAHE